jgi:hypothetical protein
MTPTRTLLEENNYVLLDDFISPKKAKELYEGFVAYKNEWPELFTPEPQCPKSLAIYDYRPFIELLVEKIPYMSEKMGELMFPTYCYSRFYKKGEVLEKHTDRPACEISITLHLGGDHSWPIWFTKPDGSTISYDLKPGQAVMYQGTVSEHWRTAFKGKAYGQVFLHYVKSQGFNWMYYFDKKNHEINKR